MPQERWDAAPQPSVVREAARGWLLGSVPLEPEDGDGAHRVPVRAARFALLRTTSDVVDNVGNLRQQTALGRDGRGEFSEAVADERIVTVREPVRIRDEPCSNTGWLWRTSESWIEDQAANRYNQTKQLYDYCGNEALQRREASLPSVGAFAFAGDGTSASLTQTPDAELVSTRYDQWGQAIARCGGADLINPAGPIVEMPAANHSIGNPRQHPFGNAAGSGLTPAQRAEFNAWRVDYWKARAQGELSRRGL